MFLLGIKIKLYYYKNKINRLKLRYSAVKKYIKNWFK